MRIRLENAVGAGVELVGGGVLVEDEICAVHAGEEELAGGEPVEGVEVGFAGQGGVGGDGAGFLPAREGWDTCADAFRGGRCGGGSHPGEFVAHLTAEFCFGRGGHKIFPR